MAPGESPLVAVVLGITGDTTTQEHLTIEYREEGGRQGSLTSSDSFQAIPHDGDQLELVRPGGPIVRLRCTPDREAAQEEIGAQLGWTWAGTDLAALGDLAPWTHGLGWEVHLHDIGRYWFLVEDLREEKGEAVRAEALWQDGERFNVRLRSERGATTESRSLNGLDFSGALGLEMALDHLRRVSHPGTDQA